MNKRIKILSQEEAKFIFAGIKERLAAHQLMDYLQTEITHETDVEDYDSWDIIWNRGKCPEILEIKVRNKFLVDFTPCGYIFEYKKFYELKKILGTDRASETGLRGKYLCFFFDGVILWDIRNVKEEDFFQKNLPKSTVNNTGDISKKITYLKYEDGIKIDFVIDYDKLKLDACDIFRFKYPLNKLNDEIINGTTNE